RQCALESQLPGDLARAGVEAVDVTGGGREVRVLSVDHGCALDRADRVAPQLVARVQVVGVRGAHGGAADVDHPVGDGRRPGAVVGGCGPRADVVPPPLLTGLLVDRHDRVRLAWPGD